MIQTRRRYLCVRRCAVSTCFGVQADSIGGINPFFGGQKETVSTRLVFNSLEFEGIKTRVVELFPHAQEQHRILVLKPLLDQRATAVEVLHHVGQ